MKSFKEVQEAFGRRHDAYTRDYHSSISGMHKHQSAAYRADGGANDEGWDREHHHKPADHPHSVHINGKKWKTFGSHSHASNVAKKIKGATVHREEVQLEKVEEICNDCKQEPCICADDSHGFVKEARMSAAVKLQRAFQRQQEKSAASRKRGEELLNPPKKDEPKKVSEGVKSPGVGWMLKKDPKLAEIIKARKEKYKSFKQHVGQKIEDKKDEK